MEQRYVIYFLCRKGFKTEDITAELDEVYQDGSLSLSKVYFWKREFRLGREDLEDEHRSGRTPYDGLDAAILCMLKDNSHATAHKMAHKFSVDPSTVARHLNNSIGMRWLHLRYIPHKLSSDQKAKRVELSKIILPMLEHSKKDSFQFTLTSDKSWIEYEYLSTNMLAFCKDDCDDIKRPNQFTKKIIITVFINGKGLVFLLNVLKNIKRKYIFTLIKHQVIIVQQ